jgi:hypothetical protein
VLIRLLCALLGLLLSAVGTAANASVPGEVSPRSFGGVRILMTPDQVERAWQVELKLTDDLEAGSPECYRAWVKGSGVVGVLTFRLQHRLNEVWLRGDVVTDTGITTGDHISEARAMYGQRLRSKRFNGHPYYWLDLGANARQVFGFHVDKRWNITWIGLASSAELLRTRPPYCW